MRERRKIGGLMRRKFKGVGKLAKVVRGVTETFPGSSKRGEDIGSHSKLKIVVRRVTEGVSERKELQQGKSENVGGALNSETCMEI